MDSTGAPPAKNRRKFVIIMVAALLIVFGVAIAILEYGNLTTVSMDVAASPHAYFVVAHGSENVTLPEDQSAVVQLPEHTNITVYVFPDPSYQITSWSVSPVSVTYLGPNVIQLVTGSDGSSIKVSVTLSYSTA